MSNNYTEIVKQIIEDPQVFIKGCEDLAKYRRYYIEYNNYYRNEGGQKRDSDVVEVPHWTEDINPENEAIVKQYPKFRELLILVVQQTLNLKWGSIERPINDNEFINIVDELGRVNKQLIIMFINIVYRIKEYSICERDQRIKEVSPDKPIKPVLFSDLVEKFKAKNNSFMDVINKGLINKGVELATTFNRSLDVLANLLDKVLNYPTQLKEENGQFCFKFIGFDSWLYPLKNLLKETGDPFDMRLAYDTIKDFNNIRKTLFKMVRDALVNQ